MADLAGIYGDICKKHGVRASRQLQETLSGRTELRLLELDLRTSYLAPKTVPVVIELVSLCSSLTALDASGCQLQNDGAVALAEALAEHPSLTKLDVSRNDLSLPAAKALFTLATNNPNVVEIKAQGTDISDVWNDRICLQTEFNADREGPTKDLCCDDGEIDGGVGRPAQRARRSLGLGPPQGDEDEEWAWSSNIADEEDWNKRMKELEAEMAEDVFASGGPERAEHHDETDERSRPPGTNPLELTRVAGPDAHEDAALLDGNPLRPQDLDEVVASLFDSGDRWTDPTFPPNPESLVSDATRAERRRRTRHITWQRGGLICGRPVLFSDPQFPSVPVQGELCDSWLRHAAAVLCGKSSDLISSLFTKAYPDIGAYEVRICKSGRWFNVAIDDWLPADASGQLLYMRNEDPCELWAALLEKAWAKLHGGYDRLERGSSGMALADLTGGLCHNICIRDHKRAKEVVTDESYWETLRGYQIDGWLIAATAKAEAGVATASLLQQGVSANQLYHVIGFHEVAGVPSCRIVRVLLAGVREEQPSKHTVWLKDDWVNGYTFLASDYLSQLRTLSQARREQGGLARWMLFEDFAITFNKVHVTRLYHLPRWRVRHTIHRAVGEWRGRQAGGRLRERYFTENPCYCIRVKEKNTPVLIQLSQPDARVARGRPTMDYPARIGVYVIRADAADRKKRKWVRDDTVVLPRFVGHRETCTEVLCQPLVHYLVIPCTETPGVTSRFGLQCYAPAPFTLHEVPSQRDEEFVCSDRWHAGTAGGRPQGSSSWVNNPQYTLDMQEPGFVSVQLHQRPPRDYFYVAFYVFKGTGGRRVEKYVAGDVALCTEFAPYKTTFSECELEAGQYTIVPMTWARGEEAEYDLSVFTRCRARLVPLRSLMATASP